MWWTQPKLALLTLAINALACAGVAVAIDNPEVRLAVFVVAQLALLAWYWRTSLRFGERHLAGDTEGAFDRRLWNRVWAPGVDRNFLPPDELPRVGGESFYRQGLGDDRETRDTLYRALSTWEGARLLWVGSLAGVAAAVISSRVSRGGGARASPPA